MKALKTGAFLLTVVAGALFAALVLVAAGLYATGILTAQKASDMVKVFDGKLASPIESTGVEAAKAQASSQASNEKELKALIEEWRVEKKAQEDALAARKDAVDAMARDLEKVRLELDATDRDVKSRTAALDAKQKAAQAAEKDAGFQMAVKTYAQMDAKDVAKALYSLSDDAALSYLKAFKDSFRAEVLTEIQKIDDKSRPAAQPTGPNKAANLLQMLSDNGADVAAAAGGAPAATK